MIVKVDARLIQDRPPVDGMEHPTLCSTCGTRDTLQRQIEDAFNVGDDVVIVRDSDYQRLVRTQTQEVSPVGSRVSLVGEYTFDAAHHLPRYDGCCARVHGHTYKLVVQIDGAIDPQTGMLIDFKDVDTLVRGVLSEYDHHNLNERLENPTAELLVHALALRIQESLDRALPGYVLVQAQLWETPRHSVIWRRDHGS